MFTFDNFIACASELDVQLAWIAIWAIIWFYFLPYLSYDIFAPYVNKQPWGKQWVDIQRRSYKTIVGIEFPTHDTALRTFSMGTCILFQHFVGGIMTLPSVVFGPGGWASSLACIGGLCEAGWELQDAMLRLWWIYNGTNKEENPPVMLALLLCHHMMGMTLVLPMNLYYRDSVYYHEFIFLLQFAACFALGISSYGYSVDVTKPAGLTQMKVISVLTWIAIVYTRILRYGWIAYHFLAQLYADGSNMFYGGIFAGLLMGIINFLFFVDATKRLIKFIPMNHKEDQVEEIAQTTVRAGHPRTSMTRRSFIMVSLKSNPKAHWTKVRAAMALGVLKEVKNTKDKKEE